MLDPVSRTQPVKAVVCPYHCMTIPARNGTSRRKKGASFQDVIISATGIKGQFETVRHASTGIWGAEVRLVQAVCGQKTKLPALSQKDKANGKKDKAGSKWERTCAVTVKKNFLKCLLETKGLRKSVGGFSQEYWILKTG